MVYVFDNHFGVFGEGTRLAMPKTIYAPDSSSLKPGSQATEGVLDKGVSGQPGYMLWPDCWTMKIQDRRLRPVSGWDSPWRGRQAWRYGYVDLLPCNRLCVTLAPSGGAPEKAQNGISWVQKVAAVELGFWLRLW